MNVFVEAILVGLFLLPMFWISKMLVGSYGLWVTLFVAGALFHLTLEFTGVNASYAKSK